ncbi:cupin domain-containing protein [Novosphingobium sp.]|uniref:cupin domain-containing protein n=1 Tax=Novosphingobium sp. TaxID=1874826 RepID=UPI0031D72E18
MAVLAMLHAVPSQAADTAPLPIEASHGAALISADDLGAQISAMKARVKPDTSLLWQPVLLANGTTAALEYWHRPRPPAVHVREAEYVTVMQGSGWMLSGGTMTQSHETHPGLLEGGEIQGGTKRALKRGDVFLIPAGMPHYFGIEGEGLVLLGIKIPSASQ